MKNDQETSYLTFPCNFPIKIMGKADLTFQAAALAIVRQHVPLLSEGAVESRYSKDNTYICLTITIAATSQDQLDAIYTDLTANELVLMVL